MLPRDAFEICFDRYQEAKVLLEHKIAAINPAASAKSAPKATLPKVAEYVGDFEGIGRRALKANPRWRGRLELFVVYYVNLCPYTDALKLLKLKPGTFDWWAQEIKKTVGSAFLKHKLFPPYRYFREPWSVREAKDLKEMTDGDTDTGGGEDPGSTPQSTTILR